MHKSLPVPYSVFSGVICEHATKCKIFSFPLPDVVIGRLPDASWSPVAGEPDAVSKCGKGATIPQKSEISVACVHSDNPVCLLPNL